MRLICWSWGIGKIGTRDHGDSIRLQPDMGLPVGIGIFLEPKNLHISLSEPLPKASNQGILIIIVWSPNP